jgi:[DsrC]-trisulfide reductase subunit J
MMRIAAGIIAALLALAVHADAPRFKIERGEACVAPTAEMRRDHMKLLLRQRDLTMHQGIRESRFSLKNCVDCHASRKTGSVLGKEGFCSSCHEYAAVSIDCFECHSPERRAQTAARP